jgi:hypothetical protein
LPFIDSEESGRLYKGFFKNNVYKLNAISDAVTKRTFIKTLRENHGVHVRKPTNVTVDVVVRKISPSNPRSVCLDFLLNGFPFIIPQTSSDYHFTVSDGRVKVFQGVYFEVLYGAQHQNRSVPLRFAIDRNSSADIRLYPLQ